MLFSRFILGSVLGALLLVWAWAAWGAMPVGTGGAEGVKAEGAKKGRELRKTPAPVSTVRKATEFVKKIEDGVLYTEGGRYSLTGVKVMDSTQDQKVAQPGKKPKKTAEMTFVNNQLKEVVIRQRK